MSDGTNYNLTVSEVKNGVNVKITGSFDYETSPEIERKLSELLSGAKEVNFDLSELEYIASAGIRVLIALKKNNSAKVKIGEMSPAVDEVLTMTGLSEVFS